MKTKHWGVPTWGWIAIAAAGVAVYLYMRRRAASSAMSGQTTDQSAGDTVSPVDAPALGGTPPTSSLPDMSGLLGGLATSADIQTLGDALNSSLQNVADSLGAAGAVGAGVGGGSTGDNSGGAAGGGDTGGSTSAAAATPSKGFWWGGKFYGPGGLSFAAFKKWETSHGGKVNQVFLAQHPAIEKAFNMPVLPPPPKGSAPKSSTQPIAPRATPKPKPKPKPKRKPKRPAHRAA